MEESDIMVQNDYSENFLEYVIDNSYDEIFVTDNNGMTIYCNKVFEKNYGISKSEIIGKNVNLLKDLGIIDKVIVNQVIKSRSTLTCVQETSTGSILLITFKPIFDQCGELSYIIQNCRDISKMSQLSKALKERNIINNDADNRNKHFITSDKEFLFNFCSEPMMSLKKTINRLSLKDVDILLLGESGTGKTSLANYIHDFSLRRNKPFVKINCATIPEKLIESELFGFEKGSFTGANKKKEGLVEQAHMGTIFLDEIAELSLGMQVKLLQLVEEKTFFPVGGVIPKKIDVRIIAATNQNLRNLISTGEFRKDLYYRLALAVVEIPPLRERERDVLLLINFYLKHFNKKYDSNISLSKDCLNILQLYSWPGNIRELEHVIEFLIVNANFSEEEITRQFLPKEIVEECIFCRQDENLEELNNKNVTLMDSIELLEKDVVKNAYQNYKSSYKVAEALGISQSKAYRLIKKYCG